MVKLIEIRYWEYQTKSDKDATILPGADLSLIYLYLLPDVSFIKCKKINISIDEKLDNEYEIWDTGPVYTVWIRKPFYRYENGLAEARINLLEDVHNAFLLLSEKKGWDKGIFEDAKKQIIENNFIFYIPLNPKLKSLNKQKICARLVVLPHPEKYAYYVRFLKGEDFICDILIYEGVPTFIYWKELFNSCKWISNNEFCVFSKEKSIIFKCFFEECKFKLEVETVNEKESKLLEVWDYRTDYKRRMELSNIDENHLRLLLGEDL